MYAIVDIETTGGVSKQHRITEIAIIQHDGEHVIKRFQSLVNPGVTIPPRITTLTGINNEMVANAPIFKEIASKVLELTRDCVFIAHNVNFDYGFIHQHFSELGIKWNPKRLCTVRMSRAIFPGMYSYSLGKLAQQMGYTIDGRHRAMGDAEFTAVLFKKLLENDHKGYLKFALNARNREATLPPNISREILDKLPSEMGVYSFIGSKGKVIYVGKANNLKLRVIDHFRGNTHTGYKSRFAEQILDVKWELCPNELIALLTEAREIKRHWPPYNNLMKRVSLNWGVFGYVDQRGYGRFSIGRAGKWDRPIVSYRNQFEARVSLDRLCVGFDLCARYCGLQESTDHCTEEVYGKCFGACVFEESPHSYNKRYENAKSQLKHSAENMVIHGAGFNAEEQSVVLIERGRYKGYGIIPKDLKIECAEDIRDYIETGYDDQDIQTIIRGHLLGKSEIRVTQL